MNVLVTSARFPVALDEIRKLGRHGHRVVAADSFRAAPGNWSRFTAARAHVTAPERSPDRFLAEVKQIIYAHKIDLVLPCFEEVFYLSRALDELSEVTRVFASPIDVLDRLHSKAAFIELMRALDLAVPATTVVRDQGELDAALRAHPRWVAKPVYSRGGIDIATNTGPLAGRLPIDRAHPSAARPWVVQDYVDGVDLCTFSIAHHGRVVAHCAYVHPVEIEHAGGIVFESIDEPRALRAVERVVEATRYHGQLGIDFRSNAHELIAIECNPRPTAGVHLMDDELLVSSIVSPPPSVRVVPAGVRRLYASALSRDLLLHWANARDDLGYLFSGVKDVYSERGDRWPAIVQLLTFMRLAAFRARHPPPPRPGTTLLAAIFDGVAWDGH